MSQRLHKAMVDEEFEIFISDDRIALTVELFPEKYWELTEALLAVAFECGTLLGARATPGEKEWIDRHERTTTPE